MRKNTFEILAIAIAFVYNIPESPLQGQIVIFHADHLSNLNLSYAVPQIKNAYSGTRMNE